ncbi:hybrid sensor histidine kinase/response regulator [Halovulum sp. GXIMD14793]
MFAKGDLRLRQGVWVGFAAASIGGLAAVLSLTFSGTSGGWSLGAVLIGFGVAVFVWLVFQALQLTARIRAFRDLFDESPHPAFLINLNGSVIGRNITAWRMCGDAVTLETCLHNTLINSAEVIYQLGRDARQQHHAQTDVIWGGAPAMLDARNVSSNLQIWQILPPRSAPTAVTDIVSEMARLLVDKAGRILSMNDAARAIVPATALTLNDVIENGPLRPNGVHKIVGRKNQPYRISQYEAQQGQTHVLLLPCGNTDISDALPDHLLEDLPVSLARLEKDGTLNYINAAARALLGTDARVGANLCDLVEGLGRPLRDRLRETAAGRSLGRSEVARCTRDGSDVFLQVTMTRMVSDGDAKVLAVLSDATELKTLEAQFVQSQKMQAVGQLAGGIAHDFNNLLTAITGHCDLLLLRRQAGDGDHADLTQIRQNANRAAGLVRQLLAFSRKQTLQPHVLHLFDTIAELAHLLDRLLGEKVTLNVTNREDIWPVRVDERQLEQVVVNLVVNARDAMPDGGEVNLQTRNLELDHDFERDRATIPAGRYSMIEVQDTGNGIPRDKINKIFEPFYTTKRVGEGTGLGLSTAYGIVKQTGGFIFVDSEVGAGTTFTIYLPVHEAEDGTVVAAETERKVEEDKGYHDLTGRGTILLVEDEAPVRSFAVRALQMRGYSVLEADSGEAALALLEDKDTHVDLFVSDVVMPGMNGPSWVRQAIVTRPDVSTIFMSGYAEDAFADGNAQIPNSSFLAKPFSLTDLTARVRKHMDQHANL